MARRRYTREFKISAVKLVNEQGCSTGQAAKSLGVDPASVREWVKKLSGEDGLAPSGGRQVDPRILSLAVRFAFLCFSSCPRPMRRYNSPSVGAFSPSELPGSRKTRVEARCPAARASYAGSERLRSARAARVGR